MREVSPMQPAAMMTPKTAAASSKRTTLVLGSRLCITAPQNRILQYLKNTFAQSISTLGLYLFTLRNEIEISPVPGGFPGYGPSTFGTAVYVTLQNVIS